MTGDDSIKKLFLEYEKAFSALDIAKNAEFFAEVFISAGPRGASACALACLSTRNVIPMRSGLCKNRRQRSDY